ncbi:MAG: cytochrome P450, partial [Candidatus Tectomicrobia bacterium]|nr:cytochrome P450 [Candidatus Tectomicrobia bacterium]
MVQTLNINEDLLCPEAIADPYTYFGRLRALDPIHWNPLWQGWIVTRHQDVTAVLLDQARFSSNRMGYLDAHASREKRQALDAYFAMLSRWLVFIDAPDHTRLRMLMQRASFTPRQLLAWRPRIQAIVETLLEQIEPGKPVDLVQTFAFPLPVLVVSELLGFPAADREQVRQWTADVALPFFLALGMDAREKWARAEQAARAFGDYARALLRERKQHPRDDLLTAMVQAEHAGDFLNEDEVVANAVLLMIAGHETTSNLLANGVLALLRHPQQMELLRQDATLLGPAVEECLRYDPPVTATVRWAKVDLELEGQQMQAGQKLLLVLAAANRDPAQFADPDRFDITRGVTPQQHVAFAVGMHYCLGA